MAGGDRITRKNSRGKGVARQVPGSAPGSPRASTAEQLIQETQACIQELSDHEDVDEEASDDNDSGIDRVGESPHPDRRPISSAGPANPPRSNSNPDRSSLRTTIGASSGRPVPRLVPSAVEVGLRHDAEAQPTVARDNNAFVQSLLMKVFEAEAAGASPAELARLREHVTLASQTLLRPAGVLTDCPRAAHDDAGKLMGTLNKVQPKPKLGTDSRAPTPQQVAQWILDIETAFRSVKALADNETRTYWILSTIQYSVRRELIQQKVNDGFVKTWEELKSEQRLLRSGDTLNSFLLQLSKKESMLHRSFFRTPAGMDDDEIKIAFVWSKIPETYCREMQRNGVLENIREWTDFERALRNAETAVTDVGARPPRQETEDLTSRGKRHASSQSSGKAYGKKQDRKASSQHQQGRRPSPGRRDSSPAGDRRPNDRDDRNGDNYRPANNAGGYQKPHWKNRDKRDDKRDERRDENTGKDKP
ncbi:hypothetical protein EJ07DRAFT_174650 [Lizonia empirigonia]|nr:hypothetical protein EJ07DRAFT_174650 [Lizonia empirigonia]